MQKEILELHKLIKLKNIDKAYVEAKKLHKTQNKNQDIVKILAYLHIQKSNFDSVIKVLDEYYDLNSSEKDFDYYTLDFFINGYADILYAKSRNKFIMFISQLSNFLKQ